VIGTGIAVVVYIFGTLAVFGQLNADELSVSANPFGDAADKIFGSTGGDIVAAGAVISALGTLNGFILLQGKMPLAAARDRIFPRRFDSENEKGVPMFGLLVSSVISTVAVIIAETSDEGFERLVLLTTVTALIPYVLSAAAQLTLIRTDPDKFVPAAFARDLVIGGLAFVYSLWTIFGAGEEAVFYSFLLLLLGIPLLVGMKWQASRGATG
jgi:APA family basic amino acid/polyamine antiporter